MTPTKIILIILVILVALTILSITSEAADIIVDDDGWGDHLTIQAAVNAANNGDTIYVWNGTYVEQVTINKEIYIIGNSSINTTASHVTNVFDITSNNVSISNINLSVNNGIPNDLIRINTQSNITVTNCSFWVRGDYGASYGTAFDIDNSEHINISFCLFRKGLTGISSDICNNISIFNNRFENVMIFGIKLYQTNYSNVLNNSISHNMVVTVISILIDNSSHCLIDNNTMNNNDWGISVFYSNNNTISNNTLTNITNTVYYTKNCSDNIFSDNYLEGSQIMSIINTEKLLIEGKDGILDATELRLDNSIVNISNTVISTANYTFSNTNTIQGAGKLILSPDANMSLAGSLVLNGISIRTSETSLNLSFTSLIATNCNFNSTFVDTSTSSLYTNCIFTSPTGLHKTIHLNGSTILESCTSNTVQIISNNTLTIRNMTIDDSYMTRDIYYSIISTSTSLTISNTTISKSLSSISSTNGTLTINDCTIRNFISTAIHIDNTTCYINRTSITATSLTTSLHATSTILYIRSTTITNGLIGFDRCDITISHSTISNLNIGITNTNLTISNSTLSYIYWQADGDYITTVTAQNTFIDKDFVTIYRHTVFRQQWLIHIKIPNPADIWIQDTHIPENTLVLEIDTYATQWTKTFDNTIEKPVNVTVVGINALYVYLTRETWLNVTPIPDIMPISIIRGWNLIGIPYTTTSNASDLLEALGSNSKLYYRSPAGLYNFLSYSHGIFRGTNFQLQYHSAYYVYSPTTGNLNIETVIGAKSEISYIQGWNLISVPGEVTITVQKFFEANPEISKLVIKNNAVYTLYTPDIVSQDVIDSTKGLYIYADNKGEWYWQLGL